MFHKAIITTLALASLTLGGCAQDQAGLTEIEYKAGEAGRPGDVRYFSGKEAGQIKATYERKGEDVKITIGATEVTAFEGQRIRAEVHIKVADVVGDIAPEIVDSIISATLCGMGVATSC